MIILISFQIHGVIQLVIAKAAVGKICSRRNFYIICINIFIFNTKVFSETTLILYGYLIGIAKPKAQGIVDSAGGFAVFTTAEIIGIKAEIFKGTVLHHFCINTAICRIVDILVEQTIQGIADINRFFITMNGNFVRSHRLWKYCCHKAFFCFTVTANQFCGNHHACRFTHCCHLALCRNYFRLITAPVYGYPAVHQCLCQVQVTVDDLFRPGQKLIFCKL